MGIWFVWLCVEFEGLGVCVIFVDVVCVIGVWDFVGVVGCGLIFDVVVDWWFVEGYGGYVEDCVGIVWFD